MSGIGNGERMIGNTGIGADPNEGELHRGDQADRSTTTRIDVHRL